MTSEQRIVALEPGASQPAATTQSLADPVEVQEVSDDWWQEEPARADRNWAAIAGLLVTVAAVAGWTALFAFANLDVLRSGAGLAQVTALIRDWSVPVLLIAVVWLIAMRNSRREAKRFEATANLLATESARLETRLTTVNRELSLAREFIAAQSRDLESLGRIAADRLSENASRLATLIDDNGKRIDSIQTVSAAALENMETLRGHLPVIASSAKDVTNNIGNAGRTAKNQIEDLIGGFNRLNEFGQASERQVHSLRDTVDTAILKFTSQADRLGSIADERFAALTERSEQFRSELDAQETEMLQGIRERAAALSSELNESRKVIDENEGEALTSLRSRLGAVRDEAAALARSLRETEGSALELWKNAIGKLEEDLSAAIARISQIDDQAMASARTRLAELAGEADNVDARMIERDRLFAEELDRRRTEFEDRNAQMAEALASRLGEFDTSLAQRRAAHDEYAIQAQSRAEQVAEQLDLIARKLDEAAGLGGDAERRISHSVAALGETLTASRAALDGTDAVIAQLTDGSVRLLELIQASVQHSSRDLPDAIGVSETKLTDVENRVSALKEGLVEAERSGARVSGHVADSTSELENALRRIEGLTAALQAGTTNQAGALSAMEASLTKVRSETLALAEEAQGKLALAIAELDRSTKAAVAGIGTLSSEAIAEVAAKIGVESAAAIDGAMKARAEEVAGKLEQAAANAAGVSREAAIQLRDQLAKVGELTGHLEQRVAHARARAEEQVDNDFARRVALITESLNSNAIDIARAMDSDVTDTAWAAYLKGDRGIFTRRAVRLLDTGEAREIAQLYEADRAFRDHVSHYIHDFEGMLRQLLSTRDGHALGVTLLSSDMGKLYVALAQAIERLRN